MVQPLLRRCPAGGRVYRCCGGGCDVGRGPGRRVRRAGRRERHDPARRTTTLAAYHDGVERYVTSFEFTGEGEEVGSIVPLPDVPTKVERGGDWTLQRLAQEVAPPVAGPAVATERPARSAQRAEVLLETKIDALDITILKGGGDEVGEWALDNGFFLTPDAPEVLDFYAERSPIFMAARFDASTRRALGQTRRRRHADHAHHPDRRAVGAAADPRPRPRRSQVVEADVFLLTDEQPKLLAGGPGLSIERSEPASDGLLADLRSDKGMEWVPERDVAHLPAGRRAPPASSTTTSRCRRTTAACRRSPTPASTGRRRSSAFRTTRAGRCGRSGSASSPPALTAVVLFAVRRPASASCRERAA